MINSVNILERRMNLKLANVMEISKGNGNTTTLLFSLKGLQMLHQERRGHVNTLVIEHSNILFHKFGPAKNQHTCQLVNMLNMKI